MAGIQIYKIPTEGAPLRIFADRGTASINPAVGMTFDLQNGQIVEINPAQPGQWFYTPFQDYVLTIPFQAQAKTSTRSLEEMDNHELNAEILKYKTQKLPYPLFSCQKHLRWALAVTPFLFTGLGIPLAIRMHRGGRSIGFGISLVILMGYYVVVMGGTGAAQRGVWPAWLAVWLGNVILASLAMVFNWRFLQQ